MSEQQDIDDGRAVEAFLANPAVKRALTAVRDRFYDEFKKATTGDERTNAWAKSRALDDLADELVGIMGNGKVAERQRDDREARQQAADKRSTGRK